MFGRFVDNRISDIYDKIIIEMSAIIEKSINNKINEPFRREFTHTLKAGNVPAIRLVLWVSMSHGNHLPSGDQRAHLTRIP